MPGHLQFPIARRVYGSLIRVIDLEPDDLVFQQSLERIMFTLNKQLAIMGELGNFFYKNHELPIKFLHKEHKKQVQNFNSKL